MCIFVLKNFRQGFNIKLTLQIYSNIWRKKKRRKKNDVISLQIIQINNVYIFFSFSFSFRFLFSAIANQFNRNVSTNFKYLSKSTNSRNVQNLHIYNLLSSLNKYRFVPRFGYKDRLVSSINLSMVCGNFTVFYQYIGIYM